MSDVILVSCDLIEELKIDTETALLKEALAKRGIRTKLVTWEDNSVKWGETTLAINRVVSSYVFNPEKFIEWSKKVEKNTILWNSSQVIEWNIHKKYLIELFDSGIPVPELHFIPKNTSKNIAEILDEFPFDDFVLKPCVCNGSIGLRRFQPDSTELESHFRNLIKNGYQQDFEFTDRVFEYPPGDILIQRYVPEIKTHGEASLFYFGGGFSHAVLKKPKSGDFRAHTIWGAAVDHYIPSTKEIEVGLDSLNIVGHPIEFARIDMIPTKPVPLIIEVELIDPFFFFEFAAGTVDLYADHVQNFLRERQ